LTHKWELLVESLEVTDLSTKVSDLTVQELRDLIREVLDEYASGETELTPGFADELETRIQSMDWLDHDSVWKNQ